MFLKSLEIFGFKSFADRTRIEFAEGITALLGPNGCGKSNVVDAMKWVLGEQASKTLRADKMEDVIFNGTESRKALNVAEVTLTISNEKGLLNLDVSELAIKRRLYRSGESEYYINNTPVRLKELRELFWDTGVGKAAYSVMEQGKIDQILSSKPEDRRYLFEEAAGITRFKIRRADAERKLEKTEENMRRIEDVLSEVRRSHDILKVQAEKTAQHRALREAIFEHDLDIQLLRLKRFTDDFAQREENIKESKSRRDTVQAKIDSIHDAVSENMDEVNSLEEKLNGIRTEVYGLAIEKRGKENQAHLQAERQNELKTKIGQLELRQSGLQDRIETLQEDTDEQDAQVLSLQKQVRDIEKNITAFEESINLAAQKMTDNDAACTALQRDVVNLDKQRAGMEVQLRSITEDIVTELDKKLSAAGYSAKRRSSAEAQLFSCFDQLKILLNGRKNIFSDFAALQTRSEKETEQFAQYAVNSMTEILTITGQLEVFLQEYKKSSASFIDDFLAPEGIITQKRHIDTGVEENRAAMHTKQQQIHDIQIENEQLTVKISEYRKTLENLRINKTKMKAEADAAEKQAAFLRRELAAQQAALKELENELFNEQKRLDDVKEQLTELEGEIAAIDRKGFQLSEELERIEQDIELRNKELSVNQGALKDLNAELAKQNALIEKYYLDAATLETEIKNVKNTFREVHSRELMEFEERMYKITASSSDLRTELTALRQQLKDLGSVNLMAPEEYQEVKTRYDFLTGQITDMDKARADLQRITDEIKAESTDLFLSTYNKIKKNFHNMFRRLFGGGRAEIKLTDPKQVLESGIDIFAQPPGKKLENISLLSGGEKSMTAVALLFATYMVKPSPFCLLDEIDAALDEQNVTRFVSALCSFANVSQYIVITHNKKTVLGAHTMLGVTMEESGVSKIIAIKLDSDIELIKREEAVEEQEAFEEEDVAPETDVYIPPRPPRRIPQETEET
ncbi:MAG: chromosome segregation SMC family protein [Treponema sp.]